MFSGNVILNEVRCGTKNVRFKSSVVQRDDGSPRIGRLDQAGRLGWICRELQPGPGREHASRRESAADGRPLAR
jgi:hypothetical protein